MRLQIYIPRIKAWEQKLAKGRKSKKDKASPNVRLIQSIKGLSPRQFENLVYDLLVLRGMSNAKWRTPGADGGRDIEGEVISSDFSGFLKAERWYVECKRYANAIDWPTAHNKLSYALNQGADSLLIVTTSSLSAQCRDQVDIWNRNQRRPFVRDWGGAQLEQLVSSQSLILSKFFPKSSEKEKKAAALPLLTMVSKATQEIYGEAALKGVPTAAVEFAAAIAEFAADWLSRDTTGASAGASRFDEARDIPSWCVVKAKTGMLNWRPQAFRALISTVRMFSGSSKLIAHFKDLGGLRSLRITPADGAMNERLQKAVLLICSMADLEWQSNATVGTAIDRNHS